MRRLGEKRGNWGRETVLRREEEVGGIKMHEDKLESN